MLKRTLVAVLLWSASFMAYAQPALCLDMPNLSRIILTKAPIDSQHVAMLIINGSGQTYFGKWAVIGSYTVMINWQDGTNNSFDVASFVQCVL